MGGLSEKNRIRAILQWRKLFFEQKKNRSAEAYTHWDHVEKIGLPNNKHENWKYTPLDDLLSHRFSSLSDFCVSVHQCNALSLSLDAYRLVFVNNCFSSSLSDKDIGPWKIEVIKGDHHLCSKPIQSEFFLHLIESLTHEITHIRLPIGKLANKPLYLFHISQGSEDKEMLNTLYYRHHIDLEKHSQGQIFEHFVSLDPTAHFSGARITMNIDHNAKLQHIKLVSENRVSYHFSHYDLIIDRNAVVHSSTFVLGSGLTCHQTSAKLNGEGSDLSLNSLLLPSKKNINDIRTYIEHNKAFCLSRQLHKIIVRDFGKGIFNGLVKVEKHALKTDSKMINHNLLLDYSSEVNSKPQLEIYADDVQCRHGVTIGCIDDQQIFYLCSRGITRKDAKYMLICAFVTEVLQDVKNEEIKSIILDRISNSLEDKIS